MKKTITFVKRFADSTKRENTTVNILNTLLIVILTVSKFTMRGVAFFKTVGNHGCNSSTGKCVCLNTGKIHIITTQHSNQ